jgi:RimJ/RimL family protein N-acetyltransferase
VAGCSSENVASIRVLERLGFVRTGEEDGQLRWRLNAGV